MDNRDETLEVDMDAIYPLPENSVLIDCREPQEYFSGHIPVAQLMPLGEIAARGRELDRNTIVYVVCQSGNRSKKGAQQFRDLGFKAYSVNGGTLGWKKSGRELIAERG